MVMIIIPAIDIIQGKVVRLHQGNFSKQKFYSDVPEEMARLWQRKGAAFLHLVDLDGARYGEMKNREIIKRIIKSVDVPCEVGGGLRTDGDIECFLKEGAERVVLGTSAVEDAEWLKKVVSKYKEKIVVSIDFVGKKVVKKGWQEETGLTPESMAAAMQKIGVKTLIVTDITTDGTLIGPNMKRLEKILDSVDIPVIASGGISSLEDIKRLKGLGKKNLGALIIGRALYEGKINLGEAMEIAK